MTEYLIVGDIHGKIQEFRHIVENRGARRVIQVGDFGIGFMNGYIQREQTLIHHETEGAVEFIRGNHDSPADCLDTPGWIKDGTVRNDVMLIGGAWSIDGEYRQLWNMLWWPDEECTETQFLQFLDTYKVVRPRVMITHDGPDLVTKHMFTDAGLGMPGMGHIKTRTGDYLQRMFEEHQPELWIFGHWHRTKTEVINGTKFMCLGELKTTVVEM